MIIQHISTIYCLIKRQQPDEPIVLTSHILLLVYNFTNPRIVKQYYIVRCISRSTLINVLSNVVEVKIKAGIFRTSYSMAIGRYANGFILSFS